MTKLQILRKELTEQMLDAIHSGDHELAADLAKCTRLLSELITKSLPA